VAVRYEFVIPLAGHLPNKNDRLNRYEQARLTKAARMIARVFANSERARLKVPPATAPRGVKLTLVRGFRQKLLDPGQVVRSLDPILDGLVDARWLVDDQPRWFIGEKPNICQVKDNARGPAVIVEIMR
jgi:hypothetical protein